MSFSEKKDYAKQAIDESRFLAARNYYNQALEKYSEYGFFIAFECGVLSQMFVGDGEGARDSYQLSLKSKKESEGISRKTFFDETEANLCENMMLLSLSYQEYYSWSKRLESLQPKNSILRDQTPSIQTLEKRGHPWRAAMLWMTSVYIDETRDVGQYAMGASICQLMLKHRDSLRLSRFEYSLVASSYCKLIFRALMDYEDNMLRKLGRVDLGEIDFIAHDAAKLISKYTERNPFDSEMRNLLDLIMSKRPQLRERDPLSESGYSIPTMSALSWHINAKLEHACQTTEVNGFCFQLVNSDISIDNSISLQFRPVGLRNYVDKTKEIGLALQCVVASTLPHVAMTLNGLRLIAPCLEYDVNIGEGVRIESYNLQFNGESLMPLYVRGVNNNGLWSIDLSPPYDSKNAGFKTNKLILEQLLNAFESLKKQMIKLPE